MNPITRYRIEIAYDGTDYFGWQIQHQLKTIQGTLQEKFAALFGKEISLLAASRTDAGVHARGQVASFDADIDIPPDKLMWVWNNALPLDITILSLVPVARTYKPHAYIDRKIYHYHVFFDRPSPFYQRFGYYYPYPTSIDRMQEALLLFVGTHDFCSFRSAEDTRKDTVRTIFDIHMNYIKQYNWYKITVVGNAFLRHMIRRIVGAALDMGAHPERPIRMLQDIFAACNPCHPLPNAPAQGLILDTIIYEKDDAIFTRNYGK